MSQILEKRITTGSESIDSIIDNSVQTMINATTDKIVHQYEQQIKKLIETRDSKIAKLTEVLKDSCKQAKTLLNE